MIKKSILSIFLICPATSLLGGKADFKEFNNSGIYIKKYKSGCIEAKEINGKKRTWTYNDRNSASAKTKRYVDHVDTSWQTARLEDAIKEFKKSKL